MHKGGFVQRITFIAVLSIALIGCTTSVSKDDGLGYQGYSKDGEAVGEMLGRLKSNPNMKVRMDRGWTIVTSDSGHTLWSFTPEGHPAHPSYVKREVIEKDGSIYIDTSARCGAEKSVCDKLVQDFIDLNNKVLENMGQN